MRDPTDQVSVPCVIPERHVICREPRARELFSPLWVALCPCDPQLLTLVPLSCCTRTIPKKLKDRADVLKLRVAQATPDDWTLHKYSVYSDRERETVKSGGVLGGRVEHAASGQVSFTLLCRTRGSDTLWSWFDVVNTTPQMNRFRGAAMYTKWLQERSDDHNIQSDYKFTNGLKVRIQ